MVELVFGDLTLADTIMAVMTGVVGSLVLGFAYRLSVMGTPSWKPRKIVHIVMGTVIAFTAMWYSNLSGPAFATGVFLTLLLYTWAHKSDLISELLLAGSRENESRLNTFASVFMGLIAYIITFLMFPARPEIFVASFLSVAWGDAAGEVLGRPFGGRFFKKPRENKSIEGSMGVFFVTIIALVTALAVFSTEICPLCVLPQLVVIAFVVALIEMLSIGWTDNFFLPIATAILLWLIIYPGMPLFFV